MKLLLDTHTFLWYANGDRRLSTTATELLINPQNELFLSLAVVWEIAIKVGLKKLVLSSPYSGFMARAIAGYDLTLVPITVEDCGEYERLPFPDPDHRDPFDGMIITQASRNGYSVVGADGAFDAHGVTRFW